MLDSIKVKVGKGKIRVDRISIGGPFVIMWWQETIREAS